MAFEKNDSFIQTCILYFTRYLMSKVCTASSLGPCHVSSFAYGYSKIMSVEGEATAKQTSACLIKSGFVRTWVGVSVGVMETDDVWLVRGCR